MIPKVIHYCWFGNKELPPLAKMCISSWKKYLPDYEIKEWNERNFNIHIVPYTSQAYSVGKYAFVSDYARFWILYHYGGIYFDTDVEVIKNMDHIITKGNFMACEKAITLNGGYAIGPGLGIGSEKGLAFFEIILNEYASRKFIFSDGSLNTKTVVKYVTALFIQKGFVSENRIQKIEDIWIYPSEYFSPKDYYKSTITITDKTISIHHYMDSWKSPYQLFKIRCQKILGDRLTYLVVQFLRLFKG